MNGAHLFGRVNTSSSIRSRWPSLKAALALGCTSVLMIARHRFFLLRAHEIATLAHPLATLALPSIPSIESLGDLAQLGSNARQTTLFKTRQLWTAGGARRAINSSQGPRSIHHGRLLDQPQRRALPTPQRFRALTTATCERLTRATPRYWQAGHDSPGALNPRSNKFEPSSPGTSRFSKRSADTA